MPGFLLHVAQRPVRAQVVKHSPRCRPRVTVTGQPTVTMTTPYASQAVLSMSVACRPCVTAQWVTAAMRLTSNGPPLLLLDSQAICAPNGTPLLIVTAHRGVTGM